MSSTTADTTTLHRPATVIASIVLLVFLGVTATAGSIGMLSGIEALSPPDAWLDEVPMVDSWVIPGLVLGIGFGLGSLITAYGLRSRPSWGWLRLVEHATGHHWSWIATIMIGAGQALWISLELVYLPDPSILQAVYLPVGLALVVLPLTRSASEHLGSVV